MKGSKGSARGAFSVALLALLSIIGAASLVSGAALWHSFGGFQTRENGRPRTDARRLDRDRAGREDATPRPGLPRPVSFRDSDERGLLVRTWVNGAGPYTFALDTGAGATIISRRVAAEARVGMDAGSTLQMGGLSSAPTRSARRAFVNSVAVGDRDNLLPARGLAVVADGLPEDLDGILDPTELFSPLGYVIDFPAGTLGAYDPRTSDPPRAGAASEDKAVVPWLTDGTSRRPFVALNGGGRALLDTGSNFGLAVTESAARSLRIAVESPRERAGVRDLAGGHVAARRIRPATIQIGSLVLRGVPTDLLSGAHHGAPALLGRDALRPFRLTFDPAARLIRIEAR